MINEQQVRLLAEEKVKGSANFIVDVIIKSGNKISIFLDNDNGVQIADCAELSKYIEEQFDREKEDFEILVSSPGADVVFTMIRQYIKNIGKQIQIITNENEKIIATLLSVNDDSIIIQEKTKKNKTANEPKLINYNQIKEAKRIVTFN